MVLGDEPLGSDKVVIVEYSSVETVFIKQASESSFSPSTVQEQDEKAPSLIQEVGPHQT
jgi:hypothetical protein